MERNVDFSKLSNSEINIKMKGYDNDYEARKTKILFLIEELKELDQLYIKAEEELKKRGIFSDE